MDELPAARYVLPALLSVLVFGSVVVVTTSGSDKPALTPRDAPAQTTPKAGRGSSKTITVKSGDSASVIAERAEISLERLGELNPDVDLGSLSLGQRLKLAR